MRKSDLRKLDRLIRLLNQAANLADELEVLDSRGGIVGSIVGTIAWEVELARDVARAQADRERG